MTGLIIDVDGTLYRTGVAIPGAAEAVATLRAAGVPMCFATNTTRMPRSVLVDRLAAMGIGVRGEELHTAPVAAAQWLSEHGLRRVTLLLAQTTFEEFRDFEQDSERPQAVVVGDLGRQWTYERLNTAFQALVRGARLVAIQKNRAWDPGDGLCLDAGPFVVALEYASGCTAELVGKPSPAFFHTAAASMGIAPANAVVVGDSIENDVWGAQDAGCRGVLVRTGIFREEQLERASRKPDAVLDSIADLPAWLGL